MSYPSRVVKGAIGIRVAIGRRLWQLPPFRAHAQRDKAVVAAREAAVRAVEQGRQDVERLQRSLAAVATGAALPVGDYFPHRPQPPLTPDERRIVDAFHDLYYRRWREGGDTINASWLGWRTLKCPLDVWIYQELIARLRPEVIVETGTFMGGSALFLASICDLVGGGEVVTIDLDDRHRAERPLHPRIRYLSGSSVAPEIAAQVAAIVGGRSCLLILDSDHSRDHVLAELRSLSPLVSPGSYVIVEDTNVNGHPTYPDFGPGPMEAVDTFLAEDARFEIDPDLERFLLTLNPRGFLRRR